MEQVLQYMIKDVGYSRKLHGRWNRSSSGILALIQSLLSLSELSKETEAMPNASNNVSEWRPEIGLLAISDTAVKVPYPPSLKSEAGLNAPSEENWSGQRSRETACHFYSMRAPCAYCCSHVLYLGYLWRRSGSESISWLLLAITGSHLWDRIEH